MKEDLQDLYNQSKTLHLELIAKKPSATSVDSVSDYFNNKVMEDLKTRYDHKRILIYIELRTLFTLPSLKIESTNSLKQLLDTQECLLALRNYDATVDHWDCILNYIIKEKLPKRTNQCWEEKIIFFTVFKNVKFD